ncbi:MAG: efflux RND transporter permease subunit [Burkholderiaceae bacterium]
MSEDRANDLPALSIRRPWLVVVMNLLIMLAGIGALRGIEIRELPNIDRPVVAVRADYPGAAPETLDSEATRLIEGAAARVPGVHTVRSASEEGNLRVIIEFRPDVDLVDAANDVRDAVARIERDLPENIENLIIVKADADAEPVMQLAVSSTELAIDELTRTIDEQIEPELVSVTGVADVVAFGGRERVMRVRIDPARLAARGLAVDDVARVLRTARADIPAGSLESDDVEVLVRADASAADPAAIEALRLSPGVRLGDVADAFFSPADPVSYVRLDGRTVVNLGVLRQAQSNSVEISAGVRRAIERFNRDNPSMSVSVVSDEAIFIEGAIEEVRFSLLLAVVIVIAVVGLFLGRWRSTLIPAVSIPVSLIGTLAAIWLLGYSLNLLTLLALVLASGLVVDDTIVVLENIMRRRAQGLGPRAAAVLGTREVFFAVMATTATLAAVFIPISFLPSLTGRLFAEFGFVMAIAVALSSFVALTLAPMIAARLPGDRPPGRIERGLAAVGRPFVRLYERSLGYALRHAWWVLAICIVLALLALLGFGRLAQQLTPAEDRGVLIVRLTGPDGSSLAYMDRQLERALATVTPLRDEGLATTIYTITGRWDLNRVEIVAPLVDWDERDPSQQALAARVMDELAELPGARAQIRSGTSLGAGTGDGSIQMAITGDDHPTIATMAFEFAAAIDRELPGIADIHVDWQATQPQLGLRVDRERAEELGVGVESIDITLRALVDGAEVSEINVGDRAVPVFVQSNRRGTIDPEDLLMYRVRAGDGRLVPLAQFVRFEQGAIPAELPRYAQRRAVQVNAIPHDDYPLGRAVEDLRRIAERELPESMGLVFRGDAATFEESERDMQLTFALAMLVVFLVLVAQFESLTSATVVTLTVPFGLAAAVFALLAGGISLNIYSQIGLLLLIGVMAKNSILMVEFADQLRDRGLSVADAALQAATIRLRPILMTMASTVLGAVPLVIASGAGAEARVAIGTVIFGGLSFAALFTLFLTPVIYLGLARFSKPRAHHGEALAHELDAADHMPGAAPTDGLHGGSP